MTGARSGSTRAGVISTVVVAALVVLAAVALWPGGGAVPDRRRPAVTVSDAELAPLRAAAGLDPCPAAASPPASGPLAGVVAGCLGRPGTVDLGAALAGRPALLNVWASWCAPCRAELPVLAEYAARPGAVPVLGVDIRDDPRPALRLLADLGVTLPSVEDRGGSVTAALNIPPALPMSYVVRADGTLTRIDPPVPFRTADEVATAVDGLLAR